MAASSDVRHQPGPRPAGAEAEHALDVVDGRPDQVDPAVRVVDPVDGHLVDPQSRALGDGQQLGVEEPLLVLHQRQQLAGGVAANCLEPALGVAEPDPQGSAQEQVVGPRDELALEAALHASRPGEP
jgi:hypothetical protein